MKKNILIGVLALISILSIVFALAEKTEAERQAQLAVLNAQLAQKNAVEAQLQKEMAMAAQRVAEEQRKIAVDCSQGK